MVMAQHQQLPTSTTILGARLLREVKDEERSLEDLLLTLRQISVPSPQTLSSLPPSIQTLLHPLLSSSNPPHSNQISFHPIPSPTHLVNHLISQTLLSNGTIVLIDLTSRFSISHLAQHPLSLQSLSHLHIYHPTAHNLAITLTDIQRYMLFGSHGSKGRVWAATIIIGETGGSGSSSTGQEIHKLAKTMKEVGGVLVAVNWKGRIRVEWDEEGDSNALGKGISIEEAWMGVKEREAREMEMEVKEGSEGRRWRIVWEGGEGRFRY